MFGPENGVSRPNYKYLKTRAWYRKFRLLALFLYAVAIPLNIWHAWRWHGETNFTWSVFIIGLMISTAFISILRTILISVFGNKKGFIHPGK